MSVVVVQQRDYVERWRSCLKRSVTLWPSIR